MLVEILGAKNVPKLVTNFCPPAKLKSEKKLFDINDIINHVSEKLVDRHPHVFGDKTIEDVEGVWTQWEAIKRSEKKGTLEERHSALDGIPRHLPALQYAEKMAKKARKVAPLSDHLQAPSLPESADQFAEALLDQVIAAQAKGWSPEILLREAIRRREQTWRAVEANHS